MASCAAGALRLLCAAALLLGARACRAAEDGSTEQRCDDWCAEVDKASDCTFCACGACGFCGGSALLSGKGGGGGGAHAGGHRTPTEWRVDPAVCSAGARARLTERWNGGFRFEVVVDKWLGGDIFELDWNDAPVSVRSAYSADIVSQTDGKTVLSLKSRWNEHHGFSFNADGAYSAPTVRCSSVTSTLLASSVKHATPWPPPPPPTPPSPPAPPSPPPYPPLTADQLNPPREDECRGISVQVDSRRPDGVSLTVVVPNWRENMAVQLLLGSGESVTNVWHATLLGQNERAVSFLTASRPGASQAGHMGFQVHLCILPLTQ